MAKSWFEDRAAQNKQEALAQSTFNPGRTGHTAQYRDNSAEFSNPLEMAKALPKAMDDLAGIQQKQSRFPRESYSSPTGQNNAMGLNQRQSASDALPYRTMPQTPDFSNPAVLHQFRKQQAERTANPQWFGSPNRVGINYNNAQPQAQPQQLSTPDITMTPAQLMKFREEQAYRTANPQGFTSGSPNRVGTDYTPGATALPTQLIDRINAQQPAQQPVQQSVQQPVQQPAQQPVQPDGNKIYDYGNNRSQVGIGNLSNQTPDGLTTAMQSDQDIMGLTDPRMKITALPDGTRERSNLPTQNQLTSVPSFNEIGGEQVPNFGDQYAGQDYANLNNKTANEKRGAQNEADMDDQTRRSQKFINSLGLNQDVGGGVQQTSNTRFRRPTKERRYKDGFEGLVQRKYDQKERAMDIAEENNDDRNSQQSTSAPNLPRKQQEKGISASDQLAREKFEYAKDNPQAKDRWNKIFNDNKTMTVYEKAKALALAQNGELTEDQLRQFTVDTGQDYNDVSRLETQFAKEKKEDILDSLPKE